MGRTYAKLFCISNIFSTQQKEQAVTVKPRIEKVEDVKTSGETKEEVQSLKESTSSEESKVAVSS